MRVVAQQTTTINSEPMWDSQQIIKQTDKKKIKTKQIRSPSCMKEKNIANKVCQKDFIEHGEV